MKLNLDYPIVFFDLETTGVDVAKDISLYHVVRLVLSVETNVLRAELVSDVSWLAW